MKIVILLAAALLSACTAQDHAFSRANQDCHYEAGEKTGSNTGGFVYGQIYARCMERRGH
jgi:hypothetical protein